LMMSGEKTKPAKTIASMILAAKPCFTWAGRS
jgi:hypothetical protein